MRLAIIISAVLVASFVTKVNAVDTVGLVFPYYEDPSGMTLYYSDVKPDLASCEETFPAFYWAPQGSLPCPWEVCPRDFTFTLTSEKSDATPKKLQPRIAGFDGGLSSRLDMDSQIANIVPEEHTPEEHTRGGWRPRDSVSMDNDLQPITVTPHDNFIRLGSGDVVCVRWFRLVPRRGAGRLPSGPSERVPGSRAHLGLPLESAFRVGFETNRRHQSEAVKDATLGKSNHQATFVPDDRFPNHKVLVILHTPYNR